MSESKRVLLLILIMTVAALMVGGIAVTVLYQTAFEETELRLVEIAQSQARLLEGIARCDAVHSRDYPGGAKEATLSQIRDAHERYIGFGETGEFTLAHREGHHMVFLLSHRHDDRELPKPVPFDGELAEPMRRSLSDQSGTVVGLDYRGEVVLAAYEPIAELDWGIVAKIDLAEIRAPFMTAGSIAALSGLLIVALGTVMFIRTTNPLLRHLEESEQRFRSTFEQAAVGIAHAASDGRFILLNQRFCDLIGYTQEELLSRTFREITHPDDLEIEETHVRQILMGKLATCSMEKRYIHKDGSFVWINLTASAVYEPSGTLSYLMGVVEDITQRKQMEQELIRTQRLRAVGELAAGVSHNLNNTLTGVSLPAQLIQRSTEDPDIRESADQIAASVLKAQDIIKRLNESVRGTEEEIERVDLNAVIEEAIQTTSPRWKDEAEAQGIAIEITTELEEISPIKGTRSGVLNILLNLLFNAVDAMPAGGTIMLRTRMDGDEMYLSVADTGIGMDEEMRQRAFEPFSTTKQTVDVGLGLSSIHGMVTNWGGAIEVESAPGKGTTLTIRLLPWQDTPEREDEEGENQRASRRKLLIVEDDEMVHRVLSQILSKDHEVEVIMNGRQALEQFAAGQYDVILIDLGLPGVSGDQVAAEVRKKDPTVSTVLITGWVLAEEDPRLSAFDFHMQKPLHLSLIRDAVTQAIELHDARLN